MTDVDAAGDAGRDATTSALRRRTEQEVGQAEALPLEERAPALAALTDRLARRLDDDDPSEHDDDPAGHELARSDAGA